MKNEEVCEIGKWKNASAFTSHYLRLNATDKVGEKVTAMVHKVSPLRSAESDLTWTTGMQDLGGNVREDVAQSNGEPTLPPFAFNVPDIISAEGFTFPPAQCGLSSSDCQVGLRTSQQWDPLPLAIALCYVLPDISS